MAERDRIPGNDAEWVRFEVVKSISRPAYVVKIRFPDDTNAFICGAKVEELLFPVIDYSVTAVHKKNFENFEVLTRSCTI